MKRNLARLILILAVIAWAIIVVSVLVTPVNADSATDEEPKEDDGRIPGDDVPATERCYMTAHNKQIWSWCDALFMAPPVYAAMAKITSNDAYLSYMHMRYKQTFDSLYDQKERLFYRDSSYFNKKEANGEKVFWGRGNGWVVAGELSP